MIARLVGRPVERTPGRLILDVDGVGYEVVISLNTFAALPETGPVIVLVHTHVRESEITLFGFADPGEKLLFRKLLTVAGIGPRLAIGILSQIPAADLAAAIRSRDVARLMALPGVGKRTAERVVTELSDKLDDWEVQFGPAGAAAGVGAPSAADTLREDARLALRNLGYRDAAVDDALERVLSAQERTAAPALQDVLRQSLQVLSGS